MHFRAAVPYLVGGAILVGAAFVVLSGRAQKRFEEGQAFEREGKLTDAIERYEWAIQAYTPFGTYPPRALERLRVIAQEAEVSGSTSTAIEAWQSVVSSLAVIDNIGQPYDMERIEAETHLDELRGKGNLTSPKRTP